MNRSTNQFSEFEWILLGAGHTHLHILEMWRMRPISGVRLTCIANHCFATYSGMLPGVLAGDYFLEQMRIDLVRRCAAAGARLILGETTGLDREEQKLFLRDRAALRYDQLSIGIGSVPASITGQGYALSIKPMQTFTQRLEQRVLEAMDRAAKRCALPLTIAVVGGGAGGTEIALCLPAWLSSRWPNVPYQVAIVHRGNRLCESFSKATSRKVQSIAQERGYHLRLGCTAVEIDADGVVIHQGPSEDRQHIAADVVIWAVGAVGPPLLQGLDLSTDSRNFLLTDDFLRSVDDPSIFVVGDSGTCASAAYPKAGVYAVRQGPLLWENLQRSQFGKPLKRWRPQSDFLALMNSGDRRAVLAYKGFTTSGHWCWKLKDHIDRRFMKKHQTYELMGMNPLRQRPRPPQSAEMRCDGCGGKLSSVSLHRVLARLDNVSHDRVRLGLEDNEDVALLDFGSSSSTPEPTKCGSVMATVDFFSAFLNDLEIVGRVAALNALSDLWAKGGRPVAALAHAVVQAGSPQQQEQALTELLAGGLTEFREAGVAVVGGHSLIGEQNMIGFTLLAGESAETPLRLKSRLKVGERLILTKPLGTGVLLAAHRLARCPAEDFQQLLVSMLHSNQPACAIADQWRLSAATDVTGFGLMGHLLEMLQASQVSARIDLPTIPLLPGSEPFFLEGLESSLAPANRQGTEAMHQPPAESCSQHLIARYRAMFDPQTSGGLLLSVPVDQLAPFMRQLNAAGVTSAAVIGTIVELCERERLVTFENSATVDA
jgi:selenide, water dikinase